MPLHKGKMGLIACALLTGCAFGPRLQTGIPEVRTVPVLAGLSPQESLVRAKTFLASKQYGLAIELFKGASRDRALEAESLNGLAIAYDAIGRRDLAERYFQRALASDPTDRRARQNLAAFYAVTGNEEKRRALLAIAAELPRSVVTVETGLAAPDEDSHAAQPVSLQKKSPLGAAFQPLLANAAMPVSPIIASSAGAVVTPRDGGAIICATTANDATSTATGGAQLQIFRLSIGEVFIAARPEGVICFAGSVQPSGFAAPGLRAMSNSEYLGAVAAYLDQLNQADAGAIDIAALWRSAFWPSGVEA
ncbi:hypothetical protein ACTJI5_22170 [Sphingopyxis sp. 22461]